MIISELSTLLVVKVVGVARVEVAIMVVVEVVGVEDVLKMIVLPELMLVVFEVIVFIVVAVAVEVVVYIFDTLAVVLEVATFDLVVILATLAVDVDVANVSVSYSSVLCVVLVTVVGSVSDVIVVMDLDVKENAVSFKAVDVRIVGVTVDNCN